MLIDDQYRQCVCFLGVHEKSDTGTMEWKARATAFFIGMQLNSTGWIHYLVTARHIIDQSRTEGSLYAQINLRSGGVTFVEVPQDAWLCHHLTDAAVVTFPYDDAYRVSAVPATLLAKEDENSVFTRVDVGDEVFLVGLFAGFTGVEQAEPITRFGHISLSRKQIPLTLSPHSRPKQVDAYLVETKSWGGESGSPVFHCKWPNSPTVPISSINPKLIGLLHGHYDITKQTRSRSESVDLNSGIGVAIPANAIWELLMDEGLVAAREERLKQVRRNIAVPAADSTQE